MIRMKMVKMFLCLLAVSDLLTGSVLTGSVLTGSVLTGTVSAVTTDSADNRFDIAGNVIADKNIGGDYIAFGQTVKLESGVKGDIIAGGRTIVITDEDTVMNIFAVGQTITVRAKSARNIYAAGGDITITAGTETKGAYLVGGTISFGGTAIDAYLAGVSVTADGVINGNMTIRSDHITFSRNASVGGRLTVIGSVKPQLPPNIDPAKMTFKRIVRTKHENATAGEVGISRFKVIMAAVGVVTSILLALLMTAFRGGYFKAKAAEFKKRAWKEFLVGLIAFIVVPVGALVGMLTVFAIPISIIVLILYGVTIYLAPAVTGIILGRLLLKRMNRYAAAMFGAAAVSILLIVPILKVLIFAACAFYTLGIAVVSLRSRRENPPENLKLRE